MAKRMLNITMIEGDACGALLCNLKPGHASVYKISREELSKYKKLDDMSKPGIYFLSGKGGHVYVGQANERMNGQGIWLRVSEHNRDKEDYWTEAYMVIRKGEDLTATDLNYLENRFCNMAIDAGDVVHNKKNPGTGKYSDETEVMMEPFIDEVKEILFLLGNKMFVDNEASVEVSEEPEGLKLFITKTGNQEGRSVDARIVKQGDKYILLKGSKLAVKPSKKAEDRITRKRAEYNELITEEGIVIEDIQFDSPSTLAQVATISSVNGKVELKDAEGRLLKELL